MQLKTTILLKLVHSARSWLGGIMKIVVGSIKIEDRTTLYSRLDVYHYLPPSLKFFHHHDKKEAF